MPGRDRYVIDGGVAVVTGAAGGIGSAVAERLARGGSNLALVDRDKDGLEEVAERVRVRRPDRQVSVHAVDLSEKDSAKELSEQVLADQGRVTLVVNNAGVALGGRFEQVSMDDVDWLLAINLRAVMAVTSAFLPHLERGAHITNLSSLFGIIGPVGNATYSASKFGVRGFSLAIREELKPRGIGVTAVHPGGIRTSIARNARRGVALSEAEWEMGLAIFDKFLVIPPDVAARKIVDGTAQRKGRVLIGPEAYLGDALARLAPIGHAKVFETLMRLKASR